MTEERPPAGGGEPAAEGEGASVPGGGQPPQSEQAPEAPERPADAATEARGGLAERAAPRPPVVSHVETITEPAVTRRGILRVGFWTAMGVFLAGTSGALLDLIYPRHITGFGGVVAAGTVDKFPAGSKTQVIEGHFWLVHLTPEQGGDGLLALWWKCPHLGCTVPWRDNFTFTDPNTGQTKTGWFRCPCHGSTYTDAGVRVFGPAPRSMDTMALSISNGTINVDTGKVTPGSPDNASRAVKV